MKKYIRNGMLPVKAVMLPATALMLLAACSESDVQELFPESYQKILYIKDGGDKNVTLYVTGQDAQYSLKVCKGGSDPAKNALAKVEVMSQADVDKDYTVPFGETYKVLTTDAYSLGDCDIELGSSESARDIAISLKTGRIRDLMQAEPDTHWILPLELVSATDSVNADHNRYVIIVDEVSEPLLGFKKSGVEEFVCDISQPFSLKLPLGLVDVENRWDLTAQIAIDNDFLNSYNAENHTSITLPEHYSLSQSVELKSDRQEAIVDLSISDFGNRTSGYLMVPLKLASVSMFGISGSRSQYAALLHLTGHKFDRSTWEAKGCSEQEQEQFDWGTEPSGRAKNALDGDISTYWHYQWGSNGVGSCSGHASGKHSIMVDTKSRRLFTQIGLIQRAGGVWNILKSVRFWVSSDDAVWNGNASDTAGWTPIEGIYTFTEDLDQREFVFDIPAAEGRYLKIEVVESARGGDVGTLAEIYGYGKEL